MRDLLLRRHHHPRAVQTGEHARRRRAKQLKAVAFGTIFAGSLPHGRGRSIFEGGGDLFD
jgi:hypothetical protein